MEQHRIEMNLQVRDNVRMLRVDPAMSSGVCRILSMKVNGQQVDLLSSKRVIVNGKLWKEKEKDQQGSLTAIFSTQDPNINFSLEGLALQKENEISFVLEMYCLPERITRNLEEHTLRFPIGIGR